MTPTAPGSSSPPKNTSPPKTPTTAAPPSTCGPQKGEEEGPPLTLISKAAPAARRCRQHRRLLPGRRRDYSPISNTPTQFRTIWKKPLDRAMRRRSPTPAGPTPRPAPAARRQRPLRHRHRRQRRHLLLLPRAARRRPRRPRPAEPLRLPRRPRPVRRPPSPPTTTAISPTKKLRRSTVGLHGCTDGPIARLQVTPDDTHMAFVTADRLTSYENAGHLEMYSYTPATGAIVCDSCNPDGQPRHRRRLRLPGRPLPHRRRPHLLLHRPNPSSPSDTNGGVDVYEFADGRPQLITPGTGTRRLHRRQLRQRPRAAGLVGVSANGTDVYFSTYDTLTSEDHNGNFLKFYDARTNGGFPQPPPTQPCAAAEECHGPGTEAPAPPPWHRPPPSPAATPPPAPTKHHKKHHQEAPSTSATASRPPQARR